jgi:hypothetical protein
LSCNLLVVVPCEDTYVFNGGQRIKKIKENNRRTRTADSSDAEVALLAVGLLVLPTLPR